MKPAKIPVKARRVATSRLILRPFQPDDLPAYAAIRSNRDVARYLPGGPASAAKGAETAARLVPHFAALWDDPGFGPWAVVEKESGRLVGHLGLRLLADFGGRTELLYALDPAYHKRGYAAEGATAALVFGFEVLGLDAIIALALPENEASLKVMDRAGMTRRPGRVDVFGLSVIMAEIDAATYRKGLT